MRRVVLLSVFSAVMTMAQAHGWRGLVPLHSTRTDVEKILGVPEQSGSTAIYRTNQGVIEVNYAVAPCKGKTLGWNVPADTVLEIHFAPKDREPLKIDKTRFLLAVGHVARPTYINLRDGLKYEFLPDETLYSISYIPDKRNQRLRCAGFPAYDGGLTQYRPFDEYTSKSEIDEDARLDNFAVTLMNDPASVGYVLEYGRQGSNINDAKDRAQRVRSYLTKTRDIDKRRVIAQYGGLREVATTELYIVPRGSPPPTPTPTLTSDPLRYSQPKRGRKSGRRLLVQSDKR